MKSTLEGKLLKYKNLDSIPDEVRYCAQRGQIRKGVTEEDGLHGVCCENTVEVIHETEKSVECSTKEYYLFLEYIPKFKKWVAYAGKTRKFTVTVPDGDDWYEQPQEETERYGPYEPQELEFSVIRKAYHLREDENVKNKSPKELIKHRTNKKKVK